jgi:hypothetical protein
MFFRPSTQRMERLPAPTPVPGTPNVDARHALDRAAWLWHPEAEVDRSAFLLFRLDLESDGHPFVIQITADMRYELALDGVLIGRGPDSGDGAHWDFQRIAVEAAAGKRRLEAVVWWLEPGHQIMGRMSLRGGFACVTETDGAPCVTTGQAPWKVARLAGWELGPPLDPDTHLIGPAFHLDFSLLTAEPTWAEPAVVRMPIGGNAYGVMTPGWVLGSSGLPSQDRGLWRGGKVRWASAGWMPDEEAFPAADGPTHESASWQAGWLGDAGIWIPTGGQATVLIDFEEYLCGYPLLEYAGGKGARVSWEWAESLFEKREGGWKGHRGEIEGKWFCGWGDAFVLASGRGVARAPWWRAGRYLRLRLAVAGEPLCLCGLAVERTGYPVDLRARFTCSDASITPVAELCARGLRASMHDVFADSPYYEQMMYGADARLEMLMAYALTGDDRLGRRGIELFEASQDHSGLCAMRYPSRLRQSSATFSMFWIWMLHDFAYWRDDAAWLAQRMPAARHMVDSLRAYEDEEGLLVRPPGWLFVDWVPEWAAGWPPGSRNGTSALVNLQYLMTLQKMATLERLCGGGGYAADCAHRALRVGSSLVARFWDGGRGMFADDSTGLAWSQHAQIWAQLAGLGSLQRAGEWMDGGVYGSAMALPTVYFHHYLFEALQQMGRGEEVLPRLELWKDMIAQGLLAPVEGPEPSRSDCHAWGSHPLFHLHATVAGIRPASPGFATVRVEPRPGLLAWFESTLPHPRGEIRVRGECFSKEAEFACTLPAGVTGTIVWRGQERPLMPGVQKVSFHTNIQPTPSRS